MTAPYGGDHELVGRFPAAASRREALHLDAAPSEIDLRDLVADAHVDVLLVAEGLGEVRPGDALLLAEGTIELRVERVTHDEIQCRVTVGGRLGSRKGINVPSGLTGLSILSDKDLEDLRFGVEHGVDYLGLSFVRSAADVHAVRARVEALEGRVPLIAKIETRAALEHFDEILEAADGIMIARGPLARFRARIRP